MDKSIHAKRYNLSRIVRVTIDSSPSGTFRKIRSFSPPELPPLHEQLPPELVARLGKAAKRILWDVAIEYRDDADTLEDLTDDELVLVVGHYLLMRHTQYIGCAKP